MDRPVGACQYPPRFVLQALVCNASSLTPGTKGTTVMYSKREHFQVTLPVLSLCEEAFDDTSG